MKAKRCVLILMAILAFSLSACGSTGEDAPSNASNKTVENTKEPAPTPEPLDLSGEWKQTNSNSSDSYQALYISENGIEAYWVVEDENTTALYWAGTFEPPTDNNEPYSWTSTNDHDRTSGALLASGDDTKTFTYEGGKLTYSVSAFGETVEVEAAKQEWGYSELGSSSSSELDSMVGSGDLGDYYVEIKGAQLAEDYEGKPAIIVTYSWTNNSSDTTSAMVSTSEKAFQDGVQLDTAIIMNSDVYDSGNSMKDVRPGTTLDIQCAFLLTSETSTVEFEITEWISFSNEMVTMDFNPSAL